MKKKLQHIQILRAVAVILVVLYHLFRAQEKYFPASRVLPEISIYGASGVDLFFVISGFVMVWTTEAARTSVPNFLLKRVLRIYPMYWIVSWAVLLVYLVRPSWVNSSQGGEFSILHSFLLLPHQRLPLLMVGWSLVFEVYFYLIFALSLLLEKTWQLLAFISWIILLVAFSGVRSWFGPDVFDWAGNPVIELVTSPMSAEFVMGCLAGVFLKRENHLPLGIPCLTLGVALLFLSPLFFHPEVALGLRWDRVAAFGFPSFLLVLGAGFLEPKSDFVRWRSLVAIGDSSYSLYLIHLLVFSAGSRMFLTLGYGDTFPELRVFLLFCLALLTGLASYRFLERPLNQVLQNFVMQWMYPPKKLQASSIQALKLASE